MSRRRAAAAKLGGIHDSYATPLEFRDVLIAMAKSAHKEKAPPA